MKRFARGLIYWVSRLVFMALSVVMFSFCIGRWYLAQAGVTSDEDLSGADRNIEGWLMLLAFVPEVVVGFLIGSRFGRWIIKKRRQHFARALRLIKANKQEAGKPAA